MKKLLGILFVICVVLCGCKDTPESKIEKAFRNYGEEHFASSRSVKKIIKIECVDTLSTQELVNMAKDAAKIAEMSLKESGEFLDERSNDKRFYNLANNKKVPESVKNKMKKSFDNYMTFMQEYGLQYILLATSLKDVENITDSTVINEYLIKARIKENGVTNVRDYYAIIQNGDFGNIKIQDHKLTNDEVPEAMKTISDLLDNYFKFHNMHKEYFDALVENTAICATYLE